MKSQVTLGLAPLAIVLKVSGLRWQTALKNLDVRKQEGGEENNYCLLTSSKSLSCIHTPKFLSVDSHSPSLSKV